MIRKVFKISRTILEGNTYVRSLKPPAKAEWIVRRIEDMGPTYVKLGQFLSSRADIMDKNMISALKQLQDSSNPLPWETIQNLNLLEDDKFRFIDPIPIASASIGQVHRGQLIDGTDVVIKIRRPGIVEDIKNDMELIERICNICALLGASKIDDTIRVVSDLKHMILNETDFEKEVQNMILMTSKYPNIQIPLPFQKLCTPEMIVMSYVPSVKLTTSSATSRSSLAYSLMDTFVQHFLQHGLIHGDPHEGNVALSSVDDSILVMYDLGHVVQLNDHIRSLMKILVFEIMTENVDGVIDVIERMPEIITIRDKTNIRNFIIQYIEYIKTIDIRVLTSLDSRDKDLPLVFSSTVFEIVRIFGIVEGICVTLDPEFEYSQVFFKYVDQLMLDRDFLEYKVSQDMAKMISWIIPI